MTRTNYESAARIVRNILVGAWTGERPAWADRDRYDEPIQVGTLYRENEQYTRATLTAEAFIFFFATDNPAFDPDRCLSACGLKDVIKKSKPRRLARA